MTYEPTIETARKAPAVVCAVASRTKRLREKMEVIRQTDGVMKSFSSHEIEQLLRDFIAPLPFEADFLSGRIDRVDNAIKNF